jgi:DNA-binding sugar fermentation-stimulating protein
MFSEPIYTLPILYKAEVISRPSKSIKSPYVADIRLEDGTNALAHTPGLSCCGLVSPGKYIYVSKSNPKSKTDYTVQIAECTDSEGMYYTGIHPMVSQAIAGKLLSKISSSASWKSEIKIDSHTRIDFVGTNNDKKIYVEVKNAMISHCTTPRESRRSIFPEGYRKSKNDTFSPRAVKHAKTLSSLTTLPDTESCWLVFIVPRNDCNDGLELNPTDPIYCNAVAEAQANGVNVCVFGLDFHPSGNVYFDKELTFHDPVLSV